MGAIYIGKKLGPGGFEKEVVLKQLLPEYTSRPEFRDLVFSRGQDLGDARPRQHRAHVRSRRVGRVAVHRHGVREGRRPADDRPEGSPATQGARARRRDPHRARRARGPRLRARAARPAGRLARHHPPRRLAVEYPVFGAGRGEAVGLRHRQGLDALVGLLSRARQGRVHVARAGAQRVGRSSLRSLLARRVPVRGAHGRAAVRGRSEHAPRRHLWPAHRAAVAEAQEPAHGARRGARRALATDDRYQDATAFTEALRQVAHRSGMVFSAPQLAEHLRNILGPDPARWLQDEATPLARATKDPGPERGAGGQGGRVDRHRRRGRRGRTAPARAKSFLCEREQGLRPRRDVERRGHPPRRRRPRPVGPAVTAGRGGPRRPARPAARRAAAGLDAQLGTGPHRHAAARARHHLGARRGTSRRTGVRDRSPFGARDDHRPQIRARGDGRALAGLGRGGPPPAGRPAPPTTTGSRPAPPPLPPARAAAPAAARPRRPRRFPSRRPSRCSGSRHARTQRGMAAVPPPVPSAARAGAAAARRGHRLSSRSSNRSRTSRPPPPAPLAARRLPLRARCPCGAQDYAPRYRQADPGLRGPVPAAPAGVRARSSLSAPAGGAGVRAAFPSQPTGYGWLPTPRRCWASARGCPPADRPPPAMPPRPVPSQIPG